MSIQDLDPRWDNQTLDYDLEKHQYNYQLEFFGYPINEHLKSIQNSTMSFKTKEKLLSYFIKN